ncbi:MAG TPA: T9SS type A sorting domain-containing protein [candidate division Zixibacteria bacterium]|nr:T9SS type A sorting domain-containing protein [candidate division Zixibacteria bacterium]
MNVFKLFLICAAIAVVAGSASSAIFEINIFIDGEETDTIPQGTTYSIEIICDPGDTFGLTIAFDTDEDGVFTPSDDILLHAEPLWDNIDRSEEDEDFNPFAIDHDTTWGRMLFEIPLSLAPGGYFLIFTDSADTTTKYLYQSAPDPLFYTVSGNIEFEGIPHPDTIYQTLSVMVANLDTWFAMMAMVDSMGDYTVNWPFEPGLGYVIVLDMDEGVWGYLVDSLGYNLDDVANRDTTVFIDGHITGVDFFFPLPQYSISGRVSFEDMPEIPDSILDSIRVIARNISETESRWSDLESDAYYHFFWPEAESVIVEIYLGDYGYYFRDVLGYDTEAARTVVFVDGHLTDVDIHVPFWVPDSGMFYGDIFTTDGSIVNADSLLMVIINHWDVDSFIPETLFADVVDGSFSVMVPMERHGSVGGNFQIVQDRIPDDYMREDPRGWLNYFWVSTDEPAFYHSDTLLAKDASFKLRYWTAFAGFDSLEVKIWFDRISTYAILHRDETMTIPVHDISDWEWVHEGYYLELNYDSPIGIPENYTLVTPTERPPRAHVGDSLVLRLDRMDAFVVCSLHTPEGELVPLEDAILYISLAPYGPSVKTVHFEGGIAETYLFGDMIYKFGLGLGWDHLLDWTAEGEQRNYIINGDNSFNWTLYPIDTTFYLYIEIDSPDYDTLSVVVETSELEEGKNRSYELPKNTWVEIPMSNYFVGSSTIKIQPRHPYSDPPLTLFIANNGFIPAIPGDSIFITTQEPIDSFVIELRHDPEDVHVTSHIYLDEFYMDYYDPSDTSLVVRIELGMGGEVSSWHLPIFSERLLFNITPIGDYFRKHNFIANPDEYVMVGGPFRPDRIRKFLNYGSGEVLLTLAGYPAEFMPADTIYYPRDYFVGVGVPDYPDYRYYADLFFFRTVPYEHPFGYNSVMAFHDICDGQWTIRLPDTLPGGFVPAVRETTFYCSNIEIYPHEWNEFPINIPVIPPDGIQGYIHKNYFSSPMIKSDSLLISIFDAEAETLVTTTMSWQVTGWDPRNIMYYIPAGRVPEGNYFATMEYLGGGGEKFIYPRKNYFTYSGGLEILDDFFIDHVRGELEITITGLDSEFYAGSFVELTRVVPPEDAPIGFDNVVVREPFPEAGEALTVNIPGRKWRIRPIAVGGIIPEPPETVLSVPTETYDTFYIDFNFGDYENIGHIAGHLVRDEDDPSPVDFDSFVVKLLAVDSHTVMFDSPVDAFGGYSFDGLWTPSAFYVDVDYLGGMPVFIYNPTSLVSLGVLDTVFPPDIFIDNANAEVEVKISGLNPYELWLVSEIRFLPLDIPAIDETLFFDYTRGATSEIFRLCDGEWRIFAPDIMGIDFTPTETTLVIDESWAAYTIEFKNLADIGEGKLPQTFDFHAFPNPFNNRVHFRVTLPANELVSVDVFDLNGKRVATVAHGNFEAGVHRFTWDGRADFGGKLPSGVYFYRVATPSISKTLKGVYLK